MTLSRMAQKRDANEPAIVDALEAIGCTVDRLPGGDGRMDLLVGRHGHDVKIEVKMPGEQLSVKQKRYHAEWKGAPIHVVSDVGTAVAIMEYYRLKGHPKCKPVPEQGLA